MDTAKEYLRDESNGETSHAAREYRWTRRLAVRLSHPLSEVPAFATHAHSSPEAEERK